MPGYASVGSHSQVLTDVRLLAGHRTILRVCPTVLSHQVTLEQEITVEQVADQ